MSDKSFLQIGCSIMCKGKIISKQKIFGAKFIVIIVIYLSEKWKLIGQKKSFSYSSMEIYDFLKQPEKLMNFFLIKSNYGS